MRKITLRKSSGDRLREAFARDLNEPQRLAASAPDGFNLILAGPGSGKTRVITYRVAYLMARGVPAESILLVTFTRRAAREMVVRLEGLIGPEAAKVWAGTFHHIGNRILRRAAEPLGFAPNFTILDSEDQADDKYYNEWHFLKQGSGSETVTAWNKQDAAFRRFRQRSLHLWATQPVALYSTGCTSCGP